MNYKNVFKMKYFFFCHTPFDSSYGASNSAKTLVSQLEKTKRFDLNLIEMGSVKEFISYFRTKRTNNIISLPLPWINNFDASLDFNESIFVLIRSKIRNSIAKFICKHYFRYHLNKEERPIVHLNSLVLSELVPIIKTICNAQILCHIREVCIKEHVTLKCIREVDFFVCIDQTTKLMLVENYNIAISKIIMLPNPVVMKFTSETYVINRKKKEFRLGIVGQISLHKGIELILKMMRQLTDKDIVLYVVGSYEDNHYAQNLIKMTRNMRVVWLGHIDRFFEKGGYRNFDVLLRAESDHRVGRTMYEGLVSGNKIVIPLSRGAEITDEVLLLNIKKVYTYLPNSVNSLVSAVKKAKRDRNSLSTKIHSRFLSKLNENQNKSFGDFIDKIL